MKEVARGEPIADPGLGRPPKLSASPRAGQSRCASTTSYSKRPLMSSGPPWEQRSSDRRGLGEFGSVLPDCPGDPRPLVGQGADGLAVTPQPLEGQGPRAEAVGGGGPFLRMAEPRPAPWIDSMCR
jgi:hypothetical protein